jgi:5-oxoprolinase (ATP-hydrolysing)
MHAYRYPEHELKLGRLAREIGFTQVSLSHQVSPLIKLVSRGETTVVDAYLSPVLRRYVDMVQKNIGKGAEGGTEDRDEVREESGEAKRGEDRDEVREESGEAKRGEDKEEDREESGEAKGGEDKGEDKEEDREESGEARGEEKGENKNPGLMFMQSSGGLIDAEAFQGKDCILSGPAGGIVGAVATSVMAGAKKVITFDMGGTSTDVAQYSGEYERSLEIAGVRLRSPLMRIHTVAAGGGSILHYEGGRFRVGPDLCRFGSGTVLLPKRRASYGY